MKEKKIINEILKFLHNDEGNLLDFNVFKRAEFGTFVYNLLLEKGLIVELADGKTNTDYVVTISKKRGTDKAFFGYLQLNLQSSDKPQFFTKEAAEKFVKLAQGKYDGNYIVEAELATDVDKIMSAVMKNN